MTSRLKPVKLIAALGPDGLIGAEGRLPPWKLRQDLPRFKQLTMNSPVIMGSSTWKSLGRSKGLPGRLNVIVSRQSGQALGVDPQAQVMVVPAVGMALTAAQEWAASRPEAEAVWIIGGAQLYGAFLGEDALAPLSEMHLTYVLPQPALAAPPVDPVFFPGWKSWGPDWRLAYADADEGEGPSPEALYLVFRPAPPPLIVRNWGRMLNDAAETLCEALDNIPPHSWLDQLVRQDPSCFWRGPWLLWSRTFSPEAEAYRSSP